MDIQKKEGPNLFSYATSELSQDAFIAWLLAWADESHKNVDNDLYETGKDLAFSILKHTQSSIPSSIKSVKVSRQWKKIDVCIDIDEKFFIVLEDKVNAKEHGKQLERYKNTVQKHKKDREIIFIYFKTGNESLKTIKKIEEKKWHYFSRIKFLKVLNKSKSNNNILLDFRTNLNKIEERTNSFKYYKNITKGRATEGLYIWLQQELSVSSHWAEVSNNRGGFLGFWYYSTPSKTNPKTGLYLQIERYSGKEILLCIRIHGEWSKTTNELQKTYKLIKEKSQNKEIEITKPQRFKAGGTSKVALIKNAFIPDSEGNLNTQHLLKILKVSEDFIDEVTSEI